MSDPVYLVSEDDTLVPMRRRSTSMRLICRGSFTDEKTLREFFRMLNAIPGVQVPGDGHPPLPRIPLRALIDETGYREFIEAVEWAYQNLGQQ
ncbi:hypothetical protein [Methanoculleus horonobensis]|jgi:hypothetical protein|uniref:hypothetical protein n=1 Tax=Methanoculleus horonobensis TaxID=528314 RepID=UPI00129044BD|nr:hypothetical protein [Methanoculleus horonobensis]